MPPPPPPPSKSTVHSENGTIPKKTQRKKKNHAIDASDAASSSKSSSCSTSHPIQRGVRVGAKKRNPRVLIGSARHKESDVEALALPLGMSIAAVVAQVLERKDASGETMGVDHLSKSWMKVLCLCIISLLGTHILTNLIVTTPNGLQVAPQYWEIILWWPNSLVDLHFGCWRIFSQCKPDFYQPIHLLAGFQVFGDKFDSFVRNFEKSFRSTLGTLRLINESSQYTGEQLRYLKRESNYFDVIPPTSLNIKNGFTCSSGEEASHSELDTITSLNIKNGFTCSSGEEASHSELDIITSEEHFGTLEEMERNIDSVNHVLPLHDGEINQQLACVSPFQHSLIKKSLFSTLEKSVIEQTRSNDLKTFEISLSMKKLQLKEKQLALNSASNFLERCKLSMGFSKASFKAEKFKTELQETRHAELLKKCIDCLVAGLFIMLAFIAYGAYVYSHNRIAEATASCTPSAGSKSWWMPKPVSSFNSGLQILWCQFQVVSRAIFGMLMILAIVFLLVQRSAISMSHTMPVTFVLLLGVACGFAGKLCIDTLGGSGYWWLLYWEVLCLLHFFSNICISALFCILHGPITTVSEGINNSKTMLPYWIRRFLFYASLLLILPLLCGLIPFASPGEWKDHFSLLVIDLFRDQNY